MKKLIFSSLLVASALIASAQQEAKKDAQPAQTQQSTPQGTKACCQNKAAGQTCTKSEAKACAGQQQTSEKACAGKKEGGACCKSGQASNGQSQPAGCSHAHNAETKKDATPAEPAAAPAKTCSHGHNHSHDHGSGTAQPK